MPPSRIMIGTAGASFGAATRFTIVKNTADIAHSFALTFAWRSGRRSTKSRSAGVGGRRASSHGLTSSTRFVPHSCPSTIVNAIQGTNAIAFTIVNWPRSTPLGAPGRSSAVKKKRSSAPSRFASVPASPSRRLIAYSSPLSTPRLCRMRRGYR
jgi:hypothetical protein